MCFSSNLRLSELLFWVFNLNLNFSSQVRVKTSELFYKSGSKHKIEVTSVKTTATLGWIKTCRNWEFTCRRLPELLVNSTVWINSAQLCALERACALEEGVSEVYHWILQTVRNRHRDRERDRHWDCDRSSEEAPGLQAGAAGDGALLPGISGLRPAAELRGEDALDAEVWQTASVHEEFQETCEVQQSPAGSSWVQVLTAKGLSGPEWGCWLWCSKLRRNLDFDLNLLMVSIKHDSLTGH